MSKSQRTKGAVYEREVGEAFTKLFARPVKRQLEQTREGGADLKPGRLVVECKRRRGITVHKWMEQCVIASNHGASGEIPVVAMRGDGQDTLLVIRLEDLDRFVGEVQFLRRGESQSTNTEEKTAACSIAMLEYLDRSERA